MHSIGHPEVRGGAANSSTPYLSGAFVSDHPSPSFSVQTYGWLLLSHLVKGKLRRPPEKWGAGLEAQYVYSKANPFHNYVSIQHLRMHRILLNLSPRRFHLTTRGYLGLWVGGRKVVRKCPSLLWWGEEVRIITIPCWMREFSLSLPDGAE